MWLPHPFTTTLLCCVLALLLAQPARALNLTDIGSQWNIDASTVLEAQNLTAALKVILDQVNTRHTHWAGLLLRSLGWGYRA